MMMTTKFKQITTLTKISWVWIIFGWRLPSSFHLLRIGGLKKIRGLAKNWSTKIPMEATPHTCRPSWVRSSRRSKAQQGLSFPTQIACCQVAIEDSWKLPNPGMECRGSKCVSRSAENYNPFFWILCCLKNSHGKDWVSVRGTELIAFGSTRTSSCSELRDVSPFTFAVRFCVTTAAKSLCHLSYAINFTNIAVRFDASACHIFPMPSSSRNLSVCEFVCVCCFEQMKSKMCACSKSFALRTMDLKACQAAIGSSGWKT